jgi:hypothetical protein
MTYESILYGSAVRVLAVQALQTAGGAATFMPTIGAVLTGATTTGAGLLVASEDTPGSGNLLRQAGERVTKCGKSENDESDNPQQYSATPREGYLLTPLAVLAIVKGWDIGTYDPLRTDCAKWLDKVRDVCEQYEIPAKQRASCASHHIRADCKEAVLASGCYNMTWDEFAAWLRQYDGKFYVLMLLSALRQHVHQMWREKILPRRWHERRGPRTSPRWGESYVYFLCHAF